MSAAVSTVEKRMFRMHNKLLMDVISRQAGSLMKSLLEGIMNSVDAGATYCKVVITEKQVTIEDDGKGISKRDEVERFFETFGQPHDESEGKTYGTFRMGRGQMFSYGYNTWETGPFRMEVDFKNSGLEYQLAEQPPRQGCRIQIDLYNPLYPGDLAETERTIKTWVQYAPIPIYINGELASSDPAEEKWDHVTDEAYIRLNGTASLAVYNLGVHTMDMGAYHFGVGGVIVTRKQIKVNFARNDVQSDCPVWKKIKALANEKGQEKVTKKTQLSEYERQRVINLVSQGNPPVGAKSMPIFTTVNGRHYSAEKILKEIRNYNHNVSSCPQGDRIGDKLHQHRVAFILSEECLQKFRKGIVKVIDFVYELCDAEYAKRPDVVPFQDLSKGLDETYEFLDKVDLSPMETLWLRLSENQVHLLADKDSWYSDKREIVVGESTAASGWTDGSTYIALDRKFLRTLPFDVGGFTNLGVLLLHELTHDGPDTATHIHGPEFYEAFHDACRVKLGRFVEGCLKYAPNSLKSVGKSAQKAALRNLDAAEKIRREFATIAASVAPAVTSNQE